MSVSHRIEKTMRHWQKFHDCHQSLNDWLTENEKKVTTLKTDGATFAVIKEAIRNFEVRFTDLGMFSCVVYRIYTF